MDEQNQMRREQVRLEERAAQLDYDVERSVKRVTRDHEALMRRLASTPPDDVGGIEG